MPNRLGKNFRKP